MISNTCEITGVEVFLNEKLQYRGIQGNVEWSEDDSCWHGKILNTKHLITYEGDFFDDLKQSFKNVVEIHKKLLTEEEELNYIARNFNVTSSEKDIDKNVHDTVIYVHNLYRDAEAHLKSFVGKGILSRSSMQVNIEGLRILFKYRDKVLNRADLRGYDKCTTLIINRGGL